METLADVAKHLRTAAKSSEQRAEELKREAEALRRAAYQLAPRGRPPKNGR
jgi:hypothetical protein